MSLHHGIEIGTSPDVAATLHDPQVHGISDLDHDTIASATKDSLHGVKDGFHAGLHFPRVTFGFSSYREIKLLWSDKTTIETALKNVAVDVAGVGTGALACGKAGALIGAFFGPIGAAVGAVVGSVAGAMGGKAVADSIRFSVFNTAKAEYLTEVDAAQAAINMKIEGSRSALRSIQQLHQRQYEQGCAVIVKQTQETISTIQNADQSRL